MHTLIVLPRKPPSLADLANLISSFSGGMWLDHLTSPRGIVEQNLGSISVVYDAVFWKSADQTIEPRASKAIVADLGHCPEIAIYLNWSLTSNSEDLAKGVARALLEKWGGGLLDESGQYWRERDL